MNFHAVEKRIVMFFNNHKSKLLDYFSATISNVAVLILGWILVALLVIWHDALAGIVFVAALATVFLMHFLISEGVLKWGAKILKKQRLRPYKAYPEEIRAIGRKFSDSSFPSSHLAALVGGLIVLVAFYNQLWFLAVAATIIMAWSRLRNGMHYPSDVMAGIILGIFYGILTLYLLQII